MFVVAHVSDTHFGNDVQDPAGRAAAVMDHLLAMSPRPDILVLTGDVADHGLAHEYAAAREWLDRWPGAVAVCPGNHDVRRAYVDGLGRESRDVVDHGGYRFVLLDSLIDAVAGERVDEGRLGDDQLGWLDRQLGASDAPAFICLHHPPTTIGLELMDPIRLMDGDALAAVIDHHPHVVATLVGHAHTMGATVFAGRPLLVGGGVVSTVTADAEDVDTVWYAAPPTLALHLVDETPPRVTTHWRALPG
ncbi:MAG TPA: metallophosphoesterase [Nocardioides sp.]|jgi:3',5'-cyclic AMP phosphodiesterase CpdA|nr:metallophosphoesterase [Nocardioides sp.]